MCYVFVCFCLFVYVCVLRLLRQNTNRSQFYGKIHTFLVINKQQTKTSKSLFNTLCYDTSAEKMLWHLNHFMMQIFPFLYVCYLFLLQPNLEKFNPKIKIITTAPGEIMILNFFMLRYIIIIYLCIVIEKH